MSHVVDPSRGDVLRRSIAERSTPPEGAQNVSIIGPTLKIRGDQIEIIASGRLQLDGEVTGDVFGVEITIGESGKVTGQVVAKRIEVHGQVTGALHARELIVSATGRIEADMHYGTLVLAEGSMFEGRSRRISADATLPFPEDVADLVS